MELKKESTQPEGSPGKPTEVSPRFEETLVGERRISRLGDRLIAVILDTIVIGAAFAVIGMLIASRLGKIGGQVFNLDISALI